MAGSSDCDWTEIKETKELQTIEWIVAMLGCALFVFVSRVPQLLVPFMGRSWYDKLMVYLIALALGTMATLTFFQLIPEAIDIYHSHKVVIPCSHANEYQMLEGQPYSLVISRAGGGPSVPGDGLISHKNDSFYEGDLCYLKFAGPKMYIWEMLTVFCMVILFYNIQFGTGVKKIRTKVALKVRRMSRGLSLFASKTNDETEATEVLDTEEGIENGVFDQDENQITDSMTQRLSVVEVMKSSCSDGESQKTQESDCEKPDQTGQRATKVRIDSDDSSCKECKTEMMCPGCTHPNSNMAKDIETILANMNKESKDNHHSEKQDWKAVDKVAWVLLITIFVECFIEGMAFVIILQRAFGAGLTFLLAMLIKLVPQKLGDSVVLTKAGLNHFWESLLTLLVVLPVFLGAIFGMIFEEEMNERSHLGNFFFAALSGIFLYISLTSFFPVLQTLIDQAEKQKLTRLLLANFGFLTAIGIVLPLVYFDEDLQYKATDYICNLLKN